MEPEGLGKRSGRKVGLDSVLSDPAILPESYDQSRPVGLFGKRDLNRLEGPENTSIQPLKKSLLVDKKHDKENQVREKGVTKQFESDKDSHKSQNIATQASKTSLKSTQGPGFVVHNTGFFVKRLLGEEPVLTLKAEQAPKRPSDPSEIQKWLEELSCTPPITKTMIKDHPDYEKFEQFILTDASHNLAKQSWTRFSMTLPNSQVCDFQITPRLSDQDEWQLEWKPTSVEGNVETATGLEDVQTETFMSAEKSEKIFILSVHQNPIPEIGQKPSNSETQNATSVYLTILQTGTDITPKLTSIEYYLAY